MTAPYLLKQELDELRKEVEELKKIVKEKTETRSKQVKDGGKN